MTWTPAREAGVRVVKEREDGIVRQVLLFDDGGAEVVIVNRFLSHLTDAGYSPNTVCAYAYDLRHLARFLAEQGLDWDDFRPATALEFLGYLRRVPSPTSAATRADGGHRAGAIALGGDGATRAGGHVELLRLGDRR